MIAITADNASNNKKMVDVLDHSLFGKHGGINTKGFHKPDQYVRSSINKWRIWF